MNRRERSRYETWLLVLTGLYHTFDQWTRVLIPFSQWQLEPRPTLPILLLLNSISSAFTFVGALFVAESIDLWGLRSSALVSVIFIAIYQIASCSATNFYVYTAIQSLLVFNNMQMIVDASILHLEGEDGDGKRRTRLVTKMLIPVSIGFAAGPYCALQMILFLSSSLVFSQTTCGVLTLLTIVPIILTQIPDNKSRRSFTWPDFKAYHVLLQNPRIRWSIVFLVLVSGPYMAYDNVVRISIASAVIHDPYNMHHLFLILGATTMLVNMVVLPKLQARCNPKTLIIGSFSLLVVSYCYLAMFHDYTHLLIGMPLQVFGVSLCLGEISSQLMAAVGAEVAGKAAALIRMSQLGASILTPIVAGTYVSNSDTTALCGTSAIISLLAIPLVYKYAGFMKFNANTLPVSSGKLE